MDEFLHENVEIDPMNRPRPSSSICWLWLSPYSLLSHCITYALETFIFDK